MCGRRRCAAGYGAEWQSIASTNSVSVGSQLSSTFFFAGSAGAVRIIQLAVAKLALTLHDCFYCRNGCGHRETKTILCGQGWMGRDGKGVAVDGGWSHACTK